MSFESIKGWYKGRSKWAKILIWSVLVVSVISATASEPTEVTNTQDSRQAATQQETEPATDKAEEQKQKEAAEKAKIAEEERIANTLQEDDRYQLKEFTIESVKSILKAPSTAKFQGGFFDPLDGWDIRFISENVASVSSVVDSENSFGAMIRSNYNFMYCKSDGRFNIMQYTFEDKTSELYETKCNI